MGARELLRELQGEMSQGQFAEALGVNQSTLSRLLSGQIGASREMIIALVAAFPARRDDILGVFFDPQYAYTVDEKRTGYGN